MAEIKQAEQVEPTVDEITSFEQLVAKHPILERIPKLIPAQKLTVVQLANINVVGSRIDTAVSQAYEAAKSDERDANLAAAAAEAYIIEELNKWGESIAVNGGSWQKFVTGVNPDEFYSAMLDLLVFYKGQLGKLGFSAKS